jgi:hypothetical protein
MAKIYHYWLGVPYGTLTILCIMNKILEVFETSGKEVFTSKNKRNIFKQDSKLGIQTNVMNTEKKFTEQEKHTIYTKMNQIGFI